MEEVKRKIIYNLQMNDAGLSGVELADKTGINRMTITKYLNILSTIGLIRKKKLGSVNLWYIETGVYFEFPINFLEVQQRFLNAILLGDQNQGRRIIISIINLSTDQLKVLTEVILPTINTLNELYNRGRLGRTERISLLNMILELIDLIKFSLQPLETKPNAYAIGVVGSEDQIYNAKIGVVTLKILGWNSLYLGNVERHIDPFFDIDFQRYIAKVWGNKLGLMFICIYSTEESSLRFLSTAAKLMKSKLKGQVNIILIATAELKLVTETIEADYIAKDLQSLIDWSEEEYKKST
ncbi:MAG TPA: HTH domain-containing protein [Nitrososphaeraceae archaeon]|nr:HTH domain-containing protein [Nitrososphaeraceae archaeon]